MAEVRYAVVLLCLCGVTTVLGSQLRLKPSSGTHITSLYHHGDPEPTQTTSLPPDSVANCPSVCTCKPDGFVDCRGEKLHYIPEGLPNDTRDLYVNNNQLTSLDGYMFRNLRILTLFSAKNNSISDVKKGTFNGLSQLKLVDLSYNPLLLSGMDNVFCSMPLVFDTYLFFSFVFEHEVLTLSNETFACLRQKHLSTLSLSDNNFGPFPDGVFAGLNIDELNIRNTTTSPSLNTRAFLGTHHIGSLNLADNHLRYIPKFSLNGVKLIPNLTDISFDNNPLESLAIEDMKGLNDVETLSMNEVTLSFRSLGVKPGFTLELLPNLKKFIFCENNQLIRSQQKPLFQSTSLTYLQVKDSYFYLSDKVDIVMFGSMPNLQTLFANGMFVNDVVTYATTAFQNLTNLEELYLSRSSLTDLPSNMFKGSNNIKTLDLSFNYLVKMEINMFADMHSLQSLDISSNNIHILDPGFFRYMSQLSSAKTHGNEFSCSCDLTHFVDYVRRHLEIFKDIKRTVCAFPPALQGTPLLDAPILLSDCALGLPMPFYISVGASGISLLLLLTGSFVYRYRWHVRYLYFQMKSKYANDAEDKDWTCYQYDAFVSYNAKSIQWVRAILLPLMEEKMGLKVCLHDRDWLAGRDIVDNIVASIEGSRKVILVVTNAFACSQWCHLELTMAQHRLQEKDKNNMILIKMEDIHDYNMSPRLALQMKTQTYIEWHENNAKAQELFEKKINHAMKRPSASVRLQAV